MARPMSAVVGLAMVACVAGASCPQPAPNVLHRRAPRIVGPLHTEGQRFVDAMGRVVRLAGVGSRNLAPGSGYPSRESLARTGCQGWMGPSAEEYSTVAGLGFNSVRLSVSWANLEPTPPMVVGGVVTAHAWNLEWLRALDGAVRSYTDVGVAVILAMQQYKWSPAFRSIVTKRGVQCQGLGMPTWLYPGAFDETYLDAKCDFFADRPEPGGPLPHPQDGFVDAWRFLAARYGSNPMVVGADIINEPYAVGPCSDPASLQLGELYRKAGSAIRSVNPHVTLFLEDSQYDPGGRYALAARPPFQNQAYSFHLYTTDWNPTGLTVMRSYLARARRLDLPVWIGEFNRFGQPKAPPSDWPRQLAQMLAFCSEEGVSWDYWAYRGVDPLVDPRTHQPMIPLVPTLQAGF